MYSTNSYTQNQKESDSLKKILRTNSYERKDKLKNLRWISQEETNPDEILIFSKELIESAKEMDSVDYVFSGYQQMGNAYRLKSELTKALENYFTAAEIAEDNNLLNQQATIKISIADAYSIMGDSKNAVSYYRNSIALLKQDVEMDSIDLASAQLNLGDEYYNQKKLDSALYYFEESGRLFKLVDYEIGAAYNLGNVGLVYAEKDENEKAQENLYKAISILEEYEDYYPICVYLDAMSDVYLDKKQDAKALRFAQRSLALAKKYGLKEQIGDGYLKLSTIYQQEKLYENSLDFFKKHITYRDSVKNSDASKELELKLQEKELEKEKEIEVAKKQNELDLETEKGKTQKIISYAIGIALFLIGLFAVSLFRNNKIIAKEKERSDGLLKNILPEETANELKEKGSVTSKKYKSTSVLFTDFKGFTQFSEGLSPEELVKSIDFYFSKFDEIIDKHNLEKIKTIGDAYMCAGGLPYPTEDHAYKSVLAALEIADFVKKAMSNADKNASFDIRIGINTGSVVAGVVGTKKFAYDIWGDAVNIASRMESSGEPGKVNISESTYNLLKDNKEFVFESRGAIEAKGKGKIKMYFVDRAS
ncbi:MULTISPECIES: adenylate/guanylate cyclase domain-containing protein [Tenacibaculum]|uniref:adenylate/guanylate cyclase domain-containing protein n=1 Tax=Tenacibaculum TaxID=104267 RepID=UPI001F0A32AC|nr:MULTISPECIES: adenylate/guanylate cyclase domain-containing protein [Tenacibaculum]MCH3882419.1 tetratricopeptide repeat protein [Tenacibaculum aquimarinum]MDO6600098.1 adenylate/guanylate cyclase domain-containing protein [Tenacibaculum sp. 1_MG-2023]